MAHTCACRAVMPDTRAGRCRARDRTSGDPGRTWPPPPGSPAPPAGPGGGWGGSGPVEAAGLHAPAWGVALVSGGALFHASALAVSPGGAQGGSVGTAQACSRRGRDPQPQGPPSTPAFKPGFGGLGPSQMASNARAKSSPAIVPCTLPLTVTSMPAPGLEVNTI